MNRSRDSLKQELEIVKANIDAALDAVNAGDPEQRFGAKIAEAVAHVKHESYRIAGALEQWRGCEKKNEATGWPCRARGKWRVDAKLVLCDRHYAELVTRT